jgi:hypothetical protein
MLHYLKTAILEIKEVNTHLFRILQLGMGVQIHSLFQPLGYLFASGIEWNVINSIQVNPPHRIYNRQLSYQL